MVIGIQKCLRKQGSILLNILTLLEKSGIDYTTLRLPWLNDRDEVKYSITHKGESYVGVSVSRQSMADVVVKMITAPTYLNRESR